MALLPTESLRNGFVIVTATGALSVTTSKTGATSSGGFLKDPDGRIVVG